MAALTHAFTSFKKLPQTAVLTHPFTSFEKLPLTAALMQAFTSIKKLPLTQVLLDHKYSIHATLFLLLTDTLLTWLILEKATYTEIDWKAYIQEVAGFISGERDYKNLAGDTGPLVYPAGFVYVYAFLYRICDEGSDIRFAQVIFASLYLITLGVVIRIYRESQMIPPYALVLLILSRRLHSIYILRLFNDPVAMLPLYTCILAMTKQKWMLASLLFSIALSIKMNILLFFPAFGLLLYKAVGVAKTVRLLGLMISFQGLVAYPFLVTYPQSYIKRAFDFGRVFDYTWTVNWRFLSKETFLNPDFANLLMLAHVCVLMAFLFKRWCKQEGGVVRVFVQQLKWKTAEPNPISPDHICTLMFTSNFLGIVFARSLHFQFYSWYAHTIPYLLWKTCLPIPLRFFIFFAIELCWNIYPSTTASSIALFSCHSILLWGLWVGVTSPGDQIEEKDVKKEDFT